MNPHQHSWELPEARLEPAVVLEDWLGPVTALLKCRECATHALIYLVAWQAPELKHRIFALRFVPDGAAATYLRNIRSDYCDLTRKQNETDALIAAAEPVSHLVEVYDSDRICGVTATSSRPTLVPWRDIDPDDFPAWKNKTANN